MQTRFAIYYYEKLVFAITNTPRCCSKRSKNHPADAQTRHRTGAHAGDLFDAQHHNPGQRRFPPGRSRIQSAKNHNEYR